MLRTAFASIVALALVAGCPQTQMPDPQSPVTPVLGISATHGPAPLTVSVNGDSSTSTNAGSLKFRWDFGDGTRASSVSATHTYEHAGRYTVELRVTDAAGKVGVTSTDVHAAGTSATAVIKTDVSSGPAPLTVQFDGTDSSAADDRILDYFWDFGDSTEDRRPTVTHVYTRPGTYTVSLRVVSGGGVEDTKTATITVGEGGASLQFSGAQLATLPVSSAAVPAATVEAWFKADAPGGAVLSLGSATVVVEVVPNQTRVTLHVGSAMASPIQGNLGGAWRHVALVYDATAGQATVFLDGAAVANVVAAGNLNIGAVVIGNGYSGKIAEVRLWNTARTAADLLANMSHRLGGTESGLIGYWPIDDLTGQTLHALVGTTGFLGTTNTAEAADPAWSSDGPPL